MKKAFTLISMMQLFSFCVHAQQIKLVQFSSGYSSPLGIENCGDSRLFIVEREGRIMICDSTGKRLSKPFLDISDSILYGGERGLLGLAFDPDYAVNGFFYVNYTNENGNTQISRFKVKTNNPNVANRNSERSVLRINQPFSNHNGGCIRFGPDGYLYIAMGDGGSGGDPNNNAQNRKSLLGKILRIDVRNGLPYKIPPDNPFVDSLNYRPEIWALGLRNPWRFSFDAINGKMYIGDVGQMYWEEINVQPKGKGGNNYGWRCYEGKHAFNTDSCQPQSSYISPVYEYFHNDSINERAVTGGFVYRGHMYPSLYGKYIFTDYGSGIFRAYYKQTGRKRIKTVLDSDDGFSSFGVDKNNEMYVCNLPEGIIYHITDGSSFQNNYIISNKPAQNSLSISPNPVRDYVNVSYTASASGRIKLQVTGILGKEVYYASKTAMPGLNSWRINLNIPKGSYYISIITASGNVITKSMFIE